MLALPTSGLGDRIGRTARFLWSGWAGIAGLSLLATVWQLGHEAYGDFILPAPLATFAAVLSLLESTDTWSTAFETTRRAVKGFVMAGSVGVLIGVAAGYSAAMQRLAGPILTVVLGVPPIAWIVLAMIWFGSSDGTVMTTVVIATSPIVLVAAMEGVATRDRGLDDMAKAFGAGPIRRCLAVGMRQVGAHLFPALSIALGTAFKVAVMAELLANVGGVGGALARARAHLDVATALAWILLAVAALILIDHGVLRPLRSEAERWRDAARPWGVRR